MSMDWLMCCRACYEVPEPLLSIVNELLVLILIIDNQNAMLIVSLLLFASLVYHQIG